MSVTKTVLRGVKAQLVGRSIGILAKGLLVVLLTRVFLRPEEYGLLFLAISVLGVAGLFANMGFAASAGRYLAEYREKDPSQVAHILVTALRYNLFSIGIVGVALLLLRNRIAGVFGEPELASLFVVGVGYVAFRSLQKFTALCFQGFNRVTWSAVVDVVGSVGLIIAVVVLLSLGFGPLGALLGYVIAFGLASAVGLAILYIRFYADYERAVTAETGLSRRILEYSIPLTVTRSANVLDRRVDTLLVGFFLTPLAVGFYTLGKQITEFVIVPADSLGFTIAPTYGEQKASESLDRAARIYESTFEYTLAMYAPAAVGIMLIAEPAVRFVFGSEYLGAVPVIQVFGAYVLLRAIDKITNDSLDYLGRARARAFIKGGTAAGNFLLNIALIPLFGIVGAAAATVATTFVLVASEVYIVYAELPISAVRLGRVVVPAGIATGGMAVIVRLLQSHISGLTSLLGVVLAGVVVWAALAVVTGLLDIERIRSTLG